MADPRAEEFDGKCPSCGEPYLYSRDLDNGNWLEDPIEIEYVHEQEQPGEGNSLIRILDSCTVKQ